jgi:hypothetical protein
MKKSMREKIQERFNQIQRDRKYDEDKHTEKDLHPAHPDSERR